MKAAVNQDAEHSKTGAKFHWAEKVKLWIVMEGFRSILI